jgi:hypothetical protein
MMLPAALPEIFVGGPAHPEMQQWTDILVLAMSFVRDVLAPRLNEDDVTRIEQTSVSFFNAFIALLGADAATPKLHYLTHCALMVRRCARVHAWIDASLQQPSFGLTHAHRLGPPRLWWAMQYEAVNKTVKFSALLVRNNKSVEKTALRLLLQSASLRARFPPSSAAVTVSRSAMLITGEALVAGCGPAPAAALPYGREAMFETLSMARTHMGKLTPATILANELTVVQVDRLVRCVTVPGRPVLLLVRRFIPEPAVSCPALQPLFSIDATQSLLPLHELEAAGLHPAVGVRAQVGGRDLYSIRLWC